MLSLEPLRANETKLEIFERWMKWAKAGHDDSIFIETLDLMGLRRPVLLRWRQAPEIFSLPTSTITSTVEASASPKARLPFPREITLNEGQKESFEVVGDRRTGKSSAENLRVA